MEQEGKVYDDKEVDLSTYQVPQWLYENESGKTKKITSLYIYYYLETVVFLQEV